MGQSKNSDVGAYVSRAFQKAFSRPSVRTNLWIFAMGQLESVAFDDSEAVQTTVLDGDRSVRGIVKAIKAGKVKKICVLTGAGISSAAGIPDFRSPGTGIYYNLGKYDLPNPEAMFELDYFKKRPEAFYHFIKELLPGKYKPTYAHCFIRLLHEKGILLRCYTQNIDGLERVTGIPETALVEAHGSFATASCIECGATYPIEKLREDIEHERIPHCACGELVKPDIVLYGEPLPLKYTWMHTADMVACDMAIVMGTSLSVQPFYGLLQKVRESVPRLLINREAVGPFRFCSMSCCLRDVFLQADCDDGVIQLCEELGWRDELEAIYNAVDHIAFFQDSVKEETPSAKDERHHDENDNDNENENENENDSSKQKRSEQESKKKGEEEELKKRREEMQSLLAKQDCAKNLHGHNEIGVNEKTVEDRMVDSEEDCQTE